MPGGTIIYLDCQASWLQFPIEDRFSYQIGGWGDIPPEEYLEGSERIDKFLRKNGSPHRGGWQIPGMDPVRSVESEWGSAPGLGAAVKSYANELGFRFVRIRYQHPHEFSKLALNIHKELYRYHGLPIEGALVETFTQYDPYRVLQYRLLPLWLIFNTWDSHRFLLDTLPEIRGDMPVFFSGLTTLSRTPDMAPWEAWASAFTGRNWENVGAGPRHYPEDLVTLFQWGRRLETHLESQPRGPLPQLPIELFLRILSDPS
jgi:hypothetical protein